MVKQEKKKSHEENLTEWRQKRAEAYRSYIKTSAVGLEFGLAIVIGTGLGYAVDRYFATSPYGVIVGAIVGSIAAAKRIWLFSKRYLDRENDENNKE